MLSGDWWAHLPSMLFWLTMELPSLPLLPLLLFFFGQVYLYVVQFHFEFCLCISLLEYSGINVSQKFSKKENFSPRHYWQYLTTDVVNQR